MAPRTLARSRIQQPGWLHPNWYGRGIFSPVFYADGDPSAEPDADPEGEPEADADAEPEDDWTPPTREEWESHQAKLKSASGEAAARRKYLRAHGIDPKTGNKLNPDPEPEPEEPAAGAGKGDEPRGASAAEIKRTVERAVAEARVEGMRAAKEMVSNVNSALDELGWNGQRLSLVMQLANLDGLDADDKEGIQEEFDRVKQVFPEGFTPLQRRRNSANPANGAGGSGQNGVTAAKVDAADKKPPAPEPKDWVEKLARQATRGA